MKNAGLMDFVYQFITILTTSNKPKGLFFCSKTERTNVRFNRPGRKIIPQTAAKINRQNAQKFAKISILFCAFCQ